MRKVVAERALPCEPDVERFVLGAMMIGQTGILDTLAEEDFFFLPNLRIFRAMRSLHVEGRVPDRISVYHRLAKDGFAEAVGGLSYLVSLDESMPPLFNADSYIDILREKSRLRTITLLAESLRDQALAGTSSADLLSGLQQMGQKVAETIQTEKPLRTAGDVVAQIGRKELIKPSKTAGIDPPFGWLQRQGFRFGKKTLTTVAAATSVGKSSFLRSCCLYAARQGHRVAVYSLEDSAEEFFRGCIAELGSVNMQRFRMDTETEADENNASAALDRLVENGRLWVCDAGTVTLPQVRQDMIKAANTGDPFELLALDFLQIMTPVGRFSNDTEAFSSLSRGAKHLAQDLSLPTILASQLSRAPDKDGSKPRPPRMSDLRGSGTIENDSNNVFLMHRKQAEENAEQWLLHVNLAKYKNGCQSSQDMWFTRRYARFDEIGEEAPAYVVSAAVNGASNGMIQRNWHDD